jgi:hypothetical protein
VSEPRFGLDAPPGEALGTWADLSWAHFGLADDATIGAYLDNAPEPEPAPADDGGFTWNAGGDTPALRARLTLQQPVRIALHARKMIPEEPGG